MAWFILVLGMILVLIGIRKKNVTSVIIGLLIVLCAAIILTAIFKLSNKM